MILQQIFFENINNEKHKEFFKNLIRNKDIIFVGIGTTNVYLDTCGPSICSKLEKDGKTVFGTEDNMFNGKNLQEKTNELYEKYPEKFKIAIDSCIGSTKSIGSIIIDDKGVKPGAGIDKIAKRVGDIAIKVIISDNSGEVIKYTKLTKEKIKDTDKIIERANKSVEAAYNFISSCLKELEEEI